MKAGIIGTVDAASGGIAGKTLAPALRSPIKRQAINLPAQMAVQGAAGGGGEAAAQLATKGEIDQPGQVLLEVAGELGGAPAEVAAFTRDSARAATTPSAEAARALSTELDAGQLDPAKVETLNPNLAIQRKTQDGLINIGAAQTVDEAIAAATQATSPQDRAVDNIARILGETPNVSQPGDVRPLDSGTPGLGAPEPGIGLEAGMGTDGAAGRPLDAGRASNQPDGGAVPLADRGPDAQLSPDVADTTARIRQMEGTPTTAEPASMWFGRRGDGYQTPEDASAALPSRQRIAPDLSWKVEQMPSGRYRLAGYDTQAQQPAPAFQVKLNPTGTATIIGDPAAIKATLAQAGIDKVMTGTDRVVVGTSQAQAAVQALEQKQPPALVNTAQPAIESVANGQSEIARLRQAVKDAPPISEQHIEAIRALRNAVTQDAESALNQGIAPVYVGSTGITHVITPSAQRKGMYQVTRYNDTGAIGDSQYNSVAEAIRDNQIDKDRLSPGAADKHMQKLVEAEAEYQRKRSARDQNNQTREDAQAQAPTVETPAPAGSDAPGAAAVPATAGTGVGVEAAGVGDTGANEQSDHYTKPHAKQTLLDRLESGRAPFIDSSTLGGKKVWYAKGIGTTDTEMALPLNLTEDERKAARRAESNIELADNQEERNAAREELAAVLTPAARRAALAPTNPPIPDQTGGTPDVGAGVSQPMPVAAPTGGKTQGQIGMKFGSGEVVLTASGRETTPFPKVALDTNRKATNTVRSVDRWLMQNALDEARARGDNFNARQFEANLERPQQADKDSAEEYLFGQQPEVLRPLLRPLNAKPADPRLIPVSQRNVPKKEAKQNTPAEPVQKTPESEQVEANDQTPKQYHDARLRKMSDDTGTPLAEVREFYDTEGGRAESDRLWSAMVDKRARDGATLARQTLDKFYELNPTARLPETAFPNGYQRPDARKQEAIAKDAIRQDRREARAARAASEEQVGPYGRDLTPIAQGGKPFKTKAEADKFRTSTSNTLKTVRSPTGKGFAVMEKSAAEILRAEKAAKRLSQPNTGTAGEPLHAHGFIAAEGGLSKAAMKDAGFDRNKRVGNRWMFSDTGMTIERATEKLIEAGYLRDGASHSDAFTLLNRSANQAPQYTPEGWERMAEAEQEARRLAAQDEANADAQDFAKTTKMLGESELDELDYAVDNMPELFEAGARLTAEEADAIFEEHDANNESAVIEGDQELEQADARAAPPSRGPGDRAPGRTQEGQGSAEEGLTAPTEADALRMGLGEFTAANADTLIAQPGGTWVLLDGRRASYENPDYSVVFSWGNGRWSSGDMASTPKAAHAVALKRWTDRGNSPESFKQASKNLFLSGVQGPDLLAAPTPAQVLEQQDRANRAEELDQRAQIDREASGFQLQTQTAEQRRENTGDTFGGPSVEDYQAAVERNRKPGTAPDGPDLFASEPKPDYSGRYETDLFGEPVSAPRGNTQATQPATARVRGDAQPPAAVRDTPKPEGDFYVNTIVGTEATRKLGAKLITSAGDAATATQYLYKSAVERLDGIVTDKRGKPLAVIGGFKGAPTQASVYPATLLGEAVRVPGAAYVWFSHNHPSGTPTLSRADEALNETLSDAFRGSGIEPRGLLAVAGNQYGYVDAKGNVGMGGEILEPTDSVDVPVIDRQLGEGRSMDAIASPAAAIDVAKSYYNKSKGSGIILLDAQLRVAGWVPIGAPMVGPLRGTGALNALYRSLSQSNASAAIIAHNGDLDERLRGGYQSIVTNIARAMMRMDVRTLDVINVKSSRPSLAETGVWNGSEKGPMFSRSAKEDPRDLIIQHNLTAENLLFAARMGGLPVPSLAITKADAPMQNFGEITLLGDVNMADPKQGIKAYGADIYSPRYPNVTYQFTPAMRARAEKKVKDGLEATGTYIDWSEVERDGAAELNRQPALMWEFLSKKGITPTITRVEPQPLSAYLQPFANDTRNPFELRDDPAFQAAAWAEHLAMLTEAYGNAQEAQADVSKMQETARERGRSQIVNSFANRLETYQRDRAAAGRIDTSATKRAMQAQIEDAGLMDEFRQSNKDLMRDIGPNERIFQGYTNAGKRRYKPHTLDTVIAILKKELRGGENFNYGAGSLRAKFTPQFKSLAQIKASKDKLIPKEQFEAIKAEANDDLQAIAQSLNKPTDTAIAIMEDAPRMGLQRAAAQYDLELSDSQREMIGQYMTRLRNMPTEYFEGKLLRAVGVGEFKAAVIPENAPDEVVNLLDREGVTVYRYTKTSDGSDRARAIQQAANEIPGLMFSRTPAWRSDLRDKVAAIKMESSKEEGWRAYISGLTTKGVKPDEIEWSGVTDWLKLQTGKVTKQQVLDYLDGNGVQVQEVVLGAQSNAEADKAMEKWGIVVSRNPEDENQVAFLDRDNPDDLMTADELESAGYPIAAVRAAMEIESGGVAVGATGFPKYSQYTLPGGTNYREVLLTLPSKVAPPDFSNWKSKYVGGGEWEVHDADRKFRGLVRADSEATQEQVGKAWWEGASSNTQRMLDSTKADYRSSHWDTPNVLAHIRVDDRTDADGNRVLMVQEIQSDWGQEGKKKGFAPRDIANPTDAEVREFFGLVPGADPADFRQEMVEALQKRNRAGTLPPAPFVTSTDKWLTLALKRIITMAAQEGYDKVAFVNGEQSAERYDLSKQISKISYEKADNGNYEIYAYDLNGAQVLHEGEDVEIPISRVEELVGKEIATKIANGEGAKWDGSPARDWRDLTGLDLKVGGEGMKAFYDQIVPSATKALLKKLGGGQMEDVRFREDRGFEDSYQRSKGMVIPPITQTGFTITPEMRQKASQGLPLFGKAQTQNTGLTPTQFTQALSEAFGAKVADRLQAKGVVVPLADQTKLPAHVVPFLRDGDIVFGFYDPRTDRTYAVLENLTPDMVKGLAMHEVGVHYGFEAMLGADKYKQVMKRLDMMHAMGSKAVRAARAEAVKNAARPAQVPEETLAYLVQNSPELGLIKEVIAKIKAFLFREFGIGGKYLTEADLHMLAKAAVQHAARTEPGGVEVPAFMRQNEGMANRKDVVSRAKALGLPATGTTEQITRLVEIAEADPATWSPDDFKAIAPHLSIHQDNRPDSAARVDAIMRDGLNTGMVDSLGNMVRGEWTWARGLKGGDAYVFISGALKFDGKGNPRLAPGNKPLFHIKTEPGQDIYDAITGGAPEFSRAPATDTKAFRDWFGNSKVVDAEGKPLVVYHGTPAGGIDVFKVSKSGSLGGGIYTTPDAWAASIYANEPVPTGRQAAPTVYPVYVSIKNPAPVSEAVNVGNWRGEQAVRDTLMERGYDGVIDWRSGEIVAFRPEQIKSATGNNGNFDPKDPDIRFSRTNTAQTEGAEPVRPELSPWRDATGRLQFAPGAWLWDKLGTASGPILNKLQLKAATPELRRIMRQMKLDVAKAQDTAAAVAKESMNLSQDEREMVSDLIEKELRAGVVPPEHAIRLAATINTVMGKQTDELLQLGMLSRESAERWRGEYLPRFYESKLTEQAGDLWADAMRKLRGNGKPLKGIRGKHLRGRGMYEVIPVTQLADYETMGWEVRDPDYQPGLTDTGMVQVWRDFTRQERDKMGEIRDAGFRFVMGYMQTQKDIALGKMFEQLAIDPEMSSRLETEKFSVRVPDGKAPGTEVKTYGKLAGRYVTPETLSQLSLIEESQSEALMMYRKALGIWKEGKTVLNPVSHVNNIVSNISMAHFAGVSYGRPDKYLAAMRDFAKKSPMILEAKDNGLFLGTLSEAELMNTLPEDLKALAQKQEGTAEKVGRTTFNLMTFYLRRPMGWAYQAEDTFFRYLLYKDARERGMEPQDAVDYAQRYIFTYDDLPKTARRIRDYGIPFFAYTYKAIPALLHTALTHPERLAAPAAVLWTINAAAYAIAAGDDEDDWDVKLRRYLTDPEYREKARAKEKLERELLPEWNKGTTSLMTPKVIRLGNDELTKLPLFIDVSRIIPGGDLFDVNSNTGGVDMPQPITPSNPLLSIYAAIFLNKDPYFGKDLTDSNDTAGEKFDKRADWLWKQLSPAIAVNNYHWERGMNALAQASGGEVKYVPDFLGGDSTGIGRDGLPVQPKLAAMQTFGIKVRPYDLDAAESIQESMKQKMIRDIDTELRKLRRLENKGAVSDRAAEKERDLANVKKDRLRDGKTVDGDKR